jgi:hypothetical protein
MVRVHERAAGRVGGLAVEHERQRLIVDLHHFGGVLGECARIGDHGRHPLAGIARNIDGERPPRHLRYVEAGQQRLRCRSELAAVEHVVHAGHRQRGGLVDGDDACGRIWAGHQRHVSRAGHGDIGRETALADDETPVLAHAAIGRHETERFRAHAALTG